MALDQFSDCLRISFTIKKKNGGIPLIQLKHD